MRARTPDGKFCSQDAALYHWLPKLLDWGLANQIENMLEYAARWSRVRAAKRLHHAADVLRSPRVTEDNWTPASILLDYQQYIAIAEALRGCAKRVEEIRKGGTK